MRLPMPFNNPQTYPGHSGVDYPQREGTPIPASARGTVVSLGHNTRGGFYIWVQYDNGPLTGYHHMPSHRGCPPRGSRVDPGERIGYVGNTGNSTGPHLHSEVSGHATTDGYWQFFDPTRVIGQAPSGGASKPSKPSKPATPNKESEEDIVDMLYIFVPRVKGDSETDIGYAIHPVTGKKRRVPPGEWKAVRGSGVSVTNVTKTEAKNIPNV